MDKHGITIKNLMLSVAGAWIFGMAMGMLINHERHVPEQTPIRGEVVSSTGDMELNNELLLGCQYQKEVIIVTTNGIIEQLEKSLDTCTDKNVKIQGQFDECMVVAQDTLDSYNQLDGLFGQCMEALSNKGRTSI